MSEPNERLAKIEVSILHQENNMENLWNELHKVHKEIEQLRKGIYGAAISVLVSILAISGSIIGWYITTDMERIHRD